MRKQSEIENLKGKEILALINKCTELSNNNIKLMDIGFEANVQPSVVPLLLQFSKLSKKSLKHLEKDEIKFSNLIEFSKPKVPTVGEINKSITEYINKKNHRNYWR